MKADDTPTTPDDAAERFAAAVDGGRDDAVDPRLAHELEIVDRLAAGSRALDPDPEARERARRRLMAALADEPPPVADDGPSRAS